MIRTAPLLTRLASHQERLSSAPKVAFVPPLRDVTQARGSRLTVCGYQ